MKKVLYIIAGANGSGKTSFAKSYAKINNFHFINADEIAKRYDPIDIINSVLFELFKKDID